MSLYEQLQIVKPASGCCECPFFHGACDVCGGYTMMDEYGHCPVDNINSTDDISHAVFPEGKA